MRDTNTWLVGVVGVMEFDSSFSISVIWENFGDLLEIRLNFLIKFSSHVMHLIPVLPTV